MSMMMETQPALKPRKRPSAKTSERKAVEKVKATLILSLEASRRLTVYATFTGADRSAVIEDLINEHLRRFVVSDRGKSDDLPTDIVSSS